MFPIFEQGIKSSEGRTRVPFELPTHSTLSPANTQYVLVIYFDCPFASQTASLEIYVAPNEDFL